MSRNVVFTVSFTKRDGSVEAEGYTQAGFEKHMERCLLMSLQMTNTVTVLTEHVTDVQVQKVASSVNIRNVQP